MLWLWIILGIVAWIVLCVLAAVLLGRTIRLRELRKPRYRPPDDSTDDTGGP